MLEIAPRRYVIVGFAIALVGGYLIERLALPAGIMALAAACLVLCLLGVTALGSRAEPTGPVRRHR